MGIHCIHALQSLSQHQSLFIHDKIWMNKEILKIGRACLSLQYMVDLTMNNYLACNEHRNKEILLN